MKKIISLLLVGIFCFFGISSCTKTETKTVTVTDTVTNTVVDTLKPPITIVGFWKGNFQVTGSSTNLPATFDLNADSTLFQEGIGADGNTYYGEGTYSLSGTTFNYTLTSLGTVPGNGGGGTKQIGTGIYNASAGTITLGTWQNPGYPTNGTFSLSKTQ